MSFWLNKLNKEFCYKKTEGTKTINLPSLKLSVDNIISHLIDY